MAREDDDACGTEDDHWFRFLRLGTYMCHYCGAVRRVTP